MRGIGDSRPINTNISYFMLIKTVQYLKSFGATKDSIIVAENQIFNSFGEQSKICSIRDI